MNKALETKTTNKSVIIMRLQDFEPESLRCFVIRENKDITLMHYYLPQHLYWALKDLLHSVYLLLTLLLLFYWRIVLLLVYSFTCTQDFYIIIDLFCKQHHYTHSIKVLYLVWYLYIYIYMLLYYSIFAIIMWECIW